ncbi:von Willebrand factor A domain-containing protein 5A-like [Sycon ciliatum]|uniref:von Willebrand factor A domain-containing protein 5A-like n=1 Tax=Sycon ciliatum TaxID=27933 RepID=UPI0031F6A462
MRPPKCWGLLNALVPDRIPADIPLIGVQCECLLLNNLVEVTIKQRYKNTSANPIQAIYVFPVDDEAAVNGFTAHLGQRTVRGVIEERKEARQAYDAALAEGHGAALLEAAGSGALKVQLGNLEAGNEAEICIVYSSLCSIEENAVVLRIPTTIKERYMPASAWETLQTECQPTYRRSGVDYGLSLHVDMHMPSKIVSVSSSTHPLNVRNDAEDVHHCTAKLGVEKVAMDGDVIIRVEHSDLHKPAVVLSSQADVDQGSAALMLTFMPEFEDSMSEQAEDLEFVFLVDRSGSMGYGGGASTPIRQCRDALQLFLRSLPEGCAFNIVGFGSRYEKLFEESLVYDSKSLADAATYVSKLDSNMGGTEILTPLRDILTRTSSTPSHGLLSKMRGASKDEHQHRKLFLLTDGSVGNTAEIIHTVKDHAQSTRVFTFGVGDGAATDLVRGVARAGRGEACFIRNGEPIDEKVISQLSKSMEPTLEELDIDWGILQVKEQSPAKKDLAPIFNNTPYIVFALLSKDSQHQGQVTLKGKMSKKAVTFTVDVTPWTTSRTDCRILHSLAAKRVIRDLEEKDGQSNKDIILALALRYEVVSSQTSFLAIEEREEMKEGVMTTVRVPLSPIKAMPVQEQAQYSARRSLHAARHRAAPSGRSRGGMQAHSVSTPPRRALCTPTASITLGAVETYSAAEEEKAQPITSYHSAPRNVRMSAAMSAPRSATKRKKRMDTGRSCSAAPAMEKPTLSADHQSADPLQTIASLQHVSGYWLLDDKLLATVGLSKSDVMAAKPSTLSSSSSSAELTSNVWATAVALAYLHVKCSSKAAAFSLMEKKAKKWMAGQISESSPAVAELIATAKSLF